VLDQQGVERQPVPLGNDPSERRLGLFGAVRADDAQPVREPVHMGIDRYRRRAVPEDEDAVRRLRADAGEREELLESPWDLPAESLENLPSACA
jgi:hypothetical protein